MQRPVIWLGGYSTLKTGRTYLSQWRENSRHGETDVRTDHGEKRQGNMNKGESVQYSTVQYSYSTGTHTYSPHRDALNRERRVIRRAGERLVDAPAVSASRLFERLMSRCDQNKTCKQAVLRLSGARYATPPRDDDRDRQRRTMASLVKVARTTGLLKAVTGAPLARVGRDASHMGHTPPHHLIVSRKALQQEAPPRAFFLPGC